MTAIAVFVLILLSGLFQIAANKKVDAPAAAGERAVRCDLIVYTTLPADSLTGLAAEYEKNNGVIIQVRQLAERELTAALNERRLEPGALVFSEAALLERNKNFFMPLLSEQADMLLRQFREQEGLWTGLWFDPIIFAVNRDNLTLKLDKWSDLSRAENAVRLGIVDFILSDQAALPFYHTVAESGDEKAFEYWRQLHPKITQYAKFPQTPVRMVALGEADLSIVFQSEALRYMHDGFPVSIIYPQPATPYLLFGVASLKKEGGCSEAALQFVEWLMLDTPQYLLEQKRIFWVSAHPDSLPYRRYATRLKLTSANNLDETAKKTLLDRWVRKIRLENN